MARHGYFSHVNPVEKSTRTMADRFKAKNIPFLGCEVGVTEKEGVLHITATQAFSREQKN